MQRVILGVFYKREQNQAFLASTKHISPKEDEGHKTKQVNTLLLALKNAPDIYKSIDFRSASHSTARQERPQ